MREEQTNTQNRTRPSRWASFPVIIAVYCMVIYVLYTSFRDWPDDFPTTIECIIILILIILINIWQFRHKKI